MPEKRKQPGRPSRNGARRPPSRQQIEDAKSLLRRGSLSLRFRVEEAEKRYGRDPAWTRAVDELVTELERLAPRTATKAWLLLQGLKRIQRERGQR